MDGRPVTVRTLDVGADKLASSLDRPARRRRQSGARPARDPALAEGAGPARDAARRHPARRRARARAHPAADGLDHRRDPPGARRCWLASCGASSAAASKIADPLPPLGVMIEVPGAALAADALAQVADFFADRHQRSHAVHARHRPRRRAGGASLQPAASGGAAPDPVHHRGGAARAASRSASAARSPAIRAMRRSCSASASASCRWRRPRCRASSSASAGSISWPPRAARRQIMEQSDTGRIAALLDDFNGLA